MSIDCMTIPVWPFPDIGLTAVMVERSYSVCGPECELSVTEVSIPEDIAAAVPSRRASFVAGRQCARDALRLAGARRDEVGRREDGSPFWPDGFRGSITHAGERAAAIVTPAALCGGIGLDFEVVMEASVAEEIGGIVLSEADRTVVAEYGLASPLATTLVFSLKESLYKAVARFSGPDARFEDAELVWIGENRAVMRLLRDLSIELPEGAELQAVYTVEEGFVRTLIWMPCPG